MRVIYDIGANNGNWTKEYSKVFESADFYLFEGNPSLKKPDLEYKWFNVLLSDKDNKKVLFHNCNNTGDSYYKEQTAFYQGLHHEQLLLTRSLDSFINEHNMPLPDLIKIDTQGSEVDIFKGAVNALNNCKLVLTEVPIIEYNKGAPKLNDYIDVMRDHYLVPVGIEEVHIIDNTLVQLDIVFIKKSIKNKIFGGGQFINHNILDPLPESKATKLG